MLSPDNRSLLSSQVVPPAGYALTDALICTYSLDLATLAGVPLALLQIDPNSLGDDQAARIAAIGAVRELAQRLTVVCQAGAIHVPAEWRDAYLWLESVVVQVTPRLPRAVFHPKLWLLRFIRGEDVHYRLLVLSRNLTYDRSWDVVARLEGPVTARQNMIRANAPLIQFVEALGGDDLPVVGAFGPGHKERRDRFARELRTVRFATDGDDQEWAFWPLGIAGHRYPLAGLFDGGRSPFKSWADGSRRPGRQLLVVSPFLSDGLVDVLAKASFPVSVVSRQDALDAVAERLPQSWFQGESARVFEFLDGLSTEGLPLSGLHAKVWIADDGWNSHVWVGSANATEAAFTRNVEFLLQLTGPRGRLGVDAVLGTQGMGSLIGPYLLPQVDHDAQLETLRRQQQALGWLLTSLVAAQAFECRLEADGERTWLLSLHLIGHQPLVVEGLTVEWRARPISVQDFARAQSTADAHSYSGLALHELSLFWSIGLQVPGTELHTEATVCMAAPPGWPAFAARESAAVSRHLQDAHGLTLYLEFLLAGGDQTLAKRLRQERRRRGGRPDGGASSARPLLETLLTALATQPQALGAVVDLIEQADCSALRQDPDFRQLWAAFRDAQRQLMAAAEESGA